MNKILNIHLARNSTKVNPRSIPKQRSIHRARNRIVEHVRQNSFSVMDQTSALSEVRQNKARIDEDAER